MIENYRLNPKVLNDLRLGRVAFDFRGMGKTFTLLSFIAVTQPTSKLGNGGPIVVSRDMRLSAWTRDFWNEHFKGHVIPRFMSQKQHFEGMSGVVFLDEADHYDGYHFPLVDGHYLMFGGGVSSW